MSESEIARVVRELDEEERALSARWRTLERKEWILDVLISILLLLCGFFIGRLF